MAKYLCSICLSLSPTYSIFFLCFLLRSCHHHVCNTIKHGVACRPPSWTQCYGIGSLLLPNFLPQNPTENVEIRQKTFTLSNLLDLPNDYWQDRQGIRMRFFFPES
jgi:hypothetical protein